jgi:hypothetical protein
MVEIHALGRELPATINARSVLGRFDDFSVLGSKVRLSNSDDLPVLLAIFCPIFF